MEQTASGVATRHSLVVLVPCGTGPIQAEVDQHLSAEIAVLGGGGGGELWSVHPEPTSIANWYQYRSVELVCLVVILFFFLSVSGWDESLWD